MVNYNLIVAHDSELGIGIDNTIPWNSPIDMQWFRKITTGYSCIMGSNTYRSIMEIRGSDKVKKSGLLPNRKCYVLSNKLSDVFGCDGIFNSIDAARSFFKDTSEEVFIIGGSQVYQAFLPYIDNIFVSQIETKYTCDAFFQYPNMENFVEVFSDSVYDETAHTLITFKILSTVFKQGE